MTRYPNGDSGKVLPALALAFGAALAAGLHHRPARQPRRDHGDRHDARHERAALRRGHPDLGRHAAHHHGRAARLRQRPDRSACPRRSRSRSWSPRWSRSWSSARWPGRRFEGVGASNTGARAAGLGGPPLPARRLCRAPRCSTAPRACCWPASSRRPARSRATATCCRRWPRWCSAARRCSAAAADVAASAVAALFLTQLDQLLLTSGVSEAAAEPRSGLRARGRHRDLQRPLGARAPAALRPAGAAALDTTHWRRQSNERYSEGPWGLRSRRAPPRWPSASRPAAATTAAAAAAERPPTDGKPVAGAPSWCGSKKITLALADGFGANNWRRITSAEAQDEAKKCPSVTKYIYTDGQGNTQKAISDIKGLVAQGVNALVVFPDAGKAMLPALREAYKAGVVTVPYRVDPGRQGRHRLRLLRLDRLHEGRAAVGRLAGQGARRQGQRDQPRRPAGQLAEPRGVRGHEEGAGRRARTSSSSARRRTT